MVFRRPDNPPALLIAVLVALLALCGCDRTGESASGERATGDKPVASKLDQPDASSTPSSTPRLVTSDELPERPERIVSLAPNITEILFALGAGERVVAVTRFCDYPAEAAELPKVGGVVDTDLEAILSERPDLVVGVTSGGNKDLAKQLTKADVAHAFVRMDNLDETYWGIEKVGELVAETERAHAIVDDMKRRIDRLSSREGEETRPRVLMLFGRDPLVAAGPDTFGHELIELAGGENVLGDAKLSYPTVDIEKVISLNPERIIDASEAAKDAGDDFWDQYATIEAVASGQVHPLRDPVVLRPGPRLVEGLDKIGQAVAGRR